MGYRLNPVQKILKRIIEGLGSELPPQRGLYGII